MKNYSSSTMKRKFGDDKAIINPPKKKRRNAAVKERERLMVFNDALETLQEIIPVRLPVGRKLHKKQTVQLATKYIKFLRECLEGRQCWEERHRFMWAMDKEEGEVINAIDSASVENDDKSASKTSPVIEQKNYFDFPYQKTCSSLLKPNYCENTKQFFDKEIQQKNCSAFNTFPIYNSYSNLPEKENEFNTETTLPTSLFTATQQLESEFPMFGNYNTNNNYREIKSEQVSKSELYFVDESITKISTKTIALESVFPISNLPQARASEQMLGFVQEMNQLPEISLNDISTVFKHSETHQQVTIRSPCSASVKTEFDLSSSSAWSPEASDDSAYGTDISPPSKLSTIFLPL